ncbi:MAG: nucleotidyltransferase family protein [Clostridia bacterium]|nr:nucleotidyltransferase family protein [Clostridia bacterium]
MDCIILAAGYATRLYPLTENTPKPLLPVCDKTIIDHLISDLVTGGDIDRFVIVSNHKFADNFKEWANRSDYPAEIVVLDDGTESNETRLGAVADIKFAVDNLGIEGDLMVIAGDNVLDFSLCKFVQYFKEKGASCIMRYFEPDTERCKSSGVICTDDSDKVISMEEKPENPKSNWLAPPFYIYTAEDAKRVGEALDSGCGKDAPGSFAAWLSVNSKVYAMEMPGSRYDIGNLASYKSVQKNYKGIIR